MACWSSGITEYSTSASFSCLIRLSTVMWRLFARRGLLGLIFPILSASSESPMASLIQVVKSPRLT